MIPDFWRDGLRAGGSVGIWRFRKFVGVSERCTSEIARVQESGCGSMGIAVDRRRLPEASGEPGSPRGSSEPPAVDPW